jgi:hypothetical protein
MRVKEKAFGRLLFLAAAALFISCTMETEAEGAFVIGNKSYDSSLAITDIWLRNGETMDWINKWHGSCPGEAGLIKEVSFSTAPGVYDVRARVETYGGFSWNFYETGYLQSVKIGGGERKYIIFDGQGIYDKEILK